LKHKIRILKGAAAEFFDHCWEAAKEKGPSDQFAAEDIVSIDVDVDLLQRAVEVFGSENKAMRWFISPNHALGGSCPGELAETAEGRQEVLDVLGRIEHGIFS
jgi:putative toxin-antitoxin system antitoxin component (TIGR02293 family)